MTKAETPSGPNKPFSEGSAVSLPERSRRIRAEIHGVCLKLFLHRYDAELIRYRITTRP